ncbi:MAG: zinc-binding dehydrogenase, partial [Planctomycetes bacterium]|nr:zinc-binding dehydrogenase [Planctomycetota bacterium]
VEPVSIAFHAVRRTPVVLGATAIVVGAGMIGLCAVQALRAAGCGRIIAVDLDAARLDLARRLGADEGLPPGDPAAREADLAIECVGIPETVALAVAAVRKGGHVTLVGNVSPRAELALQAVVTRELTLAGSCASCLEYPACLDMIARGAIAVEPLLSAVAPLAEGPAWFERLRRGEAGLLKVILAP